MARFFLNVNTVYAVDVDDAFLAEHKDNLDVIADQIATQYFAGDCDAVDDTIVDFALENDTDSVSYAF